MVEVVVVVVFMWKLWFVNLFELSFFLESKFLVLFVNLFWVRKELDWKVNRGLELGKGVWDFIYVNMVEIGYNLEFVFLIIIVCFFLKGLVLEIFSWISIYMGEDLGINIKFDSVRWYLGLKLEL